MIQRPPPSPVLAYPVAIPPAKLYASRSRRKTHPIKNSSRRRVCNRASKPASPHYIHPSQKNQSLLWDNPQVVPLLYKPHRWAPRGAPGGRWKRKCRLCKNFFENILPCPCQCALLDSAQYATAKDAASPSLTRVQQIPGGQSVRKETVLRVRVRVTIFMAAWEQTASSSRSGSRDSLPRSPKGPPLRRDQ